jgi:hypothetical protein
MLGIDAALNHIEVIHENIFSWTPMLFAPLAVLFCLLCAGMASWRRAAWTFGLLGLLVGAAGTYFHDYPKLISGNAIQALLDPVPPILAPAAFAATALLLLLVSWAERWTNPQATSGE